MDSVIHALPDLSFLDPCKMGDRTGLSFRESEVRVSKAIPMEQVWFVDRNKIKYLEE
jgi:hypothetical protein